MIGQRIPTDLARGRRGRRGGLLGELQHAHHASADDRAIGARAVVVVAGRRIEQPVGGAQTLGQPTLEINLDVIALGVLQEANDASLEGHAGGLAWMWSPSALR